MNPRMIQAGLFRYELQVHRGVRRPSIIDALSRTSGKHAAISRFYGICHSLSVRIANTQQIERIPFACSQEVRSSSWNCLGQNARAPGYRTALRHRVGMFADTGSNQLQLRSLILWLDFLQRNARVGRTTTDNLLRITSALLSELCLRGHRRLESVY